MSSLTTANTICFHSSTELVVVRAFHSSSRPTASIIMPRPDGIKRLCCLTSVAYIRSAGGVCGRPAGWSVLANRARLGRPGSRLPLRASVACLGGGISWRPPAYSLLELCQKPLKYSADLYSVVRQWDWWRSANTKCFLSPLMLQRHPSYWRYSISWSQAAGSKQRCIDPGEGYNCPTETCRSRQRMLWVPKMSHFSLHCALSCGAVYCNRSCLCLCSCVGRSVTTITGNCVHRCSPNWVYR